MIVFLLALNFGISWLNCWVVGGIWAESRALGGFSRVLAWCGATQAAIGFSSVIGFVLGYVLFASGHMPPKVAHGAAALWYLLVIIPALGTGLIITIESWIIAFRTRSILDMGSATYNTFSMAYNVYQAADGGIFDALGDVGDLFDDNDAWPIMLAVVLVAVALAGGIWLTYVLIGKYAGRLPLPARGASAPIVAGH
ncbi:hypothetical protein [Pararobbsia silviterrae]|uniref:Uncharacterized protein n=1 Tax=Pararobbsia silviterrae TaxID=1792498 RepID=A0A494X327_9BURK|nr:hypothetical protein [Pararobbsia silviterrae]RKP44750.1 hypothetical protein D7S86_27400 [Pararobbsia silviterrae]